MFFFDRPRLKEHMQYCMEHPEEISKLSKLKAQITEVKGVMMDNIEKVKDNIILAMELSEDMVNLCIYSLFLASSLETTGFLQKSWVFIRTILWLNFFVVPFHVHILPSIILSSLISPIYFPYMSNRKFK